MALTSTKLYIYIKIKKRRGESYQSQWICSLPSKVGNASAEDQTNLFFQAFGGFEIITLGSLEGFVPLPGGGHLITG